MKFGAAQVVNIILQHWFLVDPTFQLPKPKNKDEKEDNFSTKFDLDMKNKGPTTSS